MGKLEIKDVNKSFAQPGSNVVLSVLEHVNLEAQSGEFVSVVGPSGCGKSTLLRAIAGFNLPTSGEVVLDGKVVEGPDPNRGMVFQKSGLFPWLTVEKNISFGPRMRGETEGLADRVTQMLKLAGLESFRDTYPHQLSGGMAQRVALVRTLINEPEVLLLDEQLGALDAFTRMHMQDGTLDLWRSQNAITMMVTHDIDEAIYMGTKVVVMAPRPGRVVEEINIDLPYPRNRSGEKFTEYRTRILNRLSLGHAD